MWLNALWRNLTQKERVESDLSCEIDSYRDMLADEKSRAGLDPATAQRQALLELGGSEQLKESVRDVRAGSRIEQTVTELRQTIRALSRNPTLTVLSVAMLALGIGGCTVVFSVFYSALIKPLPFRDPSRLCQIFETRLDRGIDRAAVSEANFWDVRARNHSFQEIAAYRYDEANLTGVGVPEKVSTIAVTAGFFRTLGVVPVLGHDFSYEDERTGWDTHVAIVGNRFWRTKFGADPAIVGKTLRLGDRAYTVVGVLPPGEPWLDSQFYVPFGFRSNGNRSSWEFSVIGRLVSGASLESARTDLKQIAAILGKSFPKDDHGIGFRLDSSNTWVASNNTRLALWVLMGAVTLLLVIACVNVANLLLARGLARQREIAIRSALGAARGRLMRFVMLEAQVLSSSGAVLGIVLAYLALEAIQLLDIPAIPRLAEAELNPWVLSFAVMIAVLTGLFSGLAPAMHSPAIGLATALRDGDRQTETRGQNRLRSVLVGAEVALSFFLLIAAGLLIRSLAQLTSVDLGFQIENRLLFSVNLPEAYAQGGRAKQFVDKLLQDLSALPSVVAVGAVNARPVEGWNPGMSIDTNFRAPSQSGHTVPWAGWRIVSPAYFRATGLPLRRGRAFDDRDQWTWSEPGQPKPLEGVIIGDRLAKLLFANADPIGKRVILWKGQADRESMVVGVVGDSRERGPAAESALTVYLPYGPQAIPQDFVIHVRANALGLAPTVRSIVARLDSNLPVSDLRTFQQVVQRSVMPQRLNAVVLSIFGGLALVLAITGIYGVLSYSISRRTAEIGLRVALGASAVRILRMTIGQGMMPAVVGVFVGLIVSLALARYFTPLLFGITPFDSTTYIGVATTLLIAALLACFFPARRAMQTNPTDALRAE